MARSIAEVSVKGKGGDGAAHRPRAGQWLAAARGLGQCHCLSFGARTRRARQNGMRTGQGQSLWRSNGGEPSWRGRPMGMSNGLQMVCVQTVSQCAPCARTQGMPSALPSARRSARAGGAATGAAPCARTQGMPLALPLADSILAPCPKNFHLLKNLATGEEKYATILATERRIMPSNGEGMLCHGC